MANFADAVHAGTAILVYTLVGFGVVGLLAHEYAACLSAFAAATRNQEAARVKVTSYCDRVDPSIQSEADRLDCERARGVALSPWASVAVHEILEEHYSHIPFYTFCSKHDECRIQFLLTMNTIRSWMPVFLFLAGGLAMYMAWRAFLEYSPRIISFLNTTKGLPVSTKYSKKLD